MKILILLITILLSCTKDKPKHYVTPYGFNKDQTINFYSRKEPFGEFSNFALFPVLVDGKAWPTSEHYYQAHKHSDPDFIEKIRTTKDPGKAAKLGRSRKDQVKANWKEIKDNIMWKAVYAKFTQHQRLRELLLSTGNAQIVEHTKNDCYWGDCGDGSGKNKLGKMLMKIRRLLKVPGH